jgi:cytochrome c-type biogenesis protein CcmH/NrfG
MTKQHFIDNGGAELRALAAQYPQHARVRYLLARYYFYTGKYDSAAVQAQHAIRLGSGAEVDQVDGMAQDLLNAAKAKKAMLDTNEPDGRK